MPWSSKGLNEGATAMTSKLVAALNRCSSRGSVTVLTDAASCSEGLLKSLRDTAFTVDDAIPFVARELLPRLQPRKIVSRLALHPTCASTRSGSNGALHQVAAAVAEEVFVPPSWTCCGFAGDRGLLHPELTASATLDQAAEIRLF
jgi:D-lactate dehydrogenase